VDDVGEVDRRDGALRRVGGADHGVKVIDQGVIGGAGFVTLILRRRRWHGGNIVAAYGLLWFLGSGRGDGLRNGL
jgi:hypothetical protein